MNFDIFFMVFSVFRVLSNVMSGGHLFYNAYGYMHQTPFKCWPAICVSCLSQL